jgi:hypothetical protein
VVREVDQGRDRLLARSEPRHPHDRVHDGRVPRVDDQVAHAVRVVVVRVHRAELDLDLDELVDGLRQRGDDRVSDLGGVARVVAGRGDVRPVDPERVRRRVGVRAVDDEVIEGEPGVGRRGPHRLDVVDHEPERVERDDPDARGALIEHQRARVQPVARAAEPELGRADAVGGAAVLEAGDPDRLERAVTLALVGARVARVPRAQRVAAAVEPGLADRVVRRVAVEILPVLVAGRHDRAGRGASAQRSVVVEAPGVPRAHQRGAVGIGRWARAGIGAAAAAHHRDEGPHQSAPWRSSCWMRRSSSGNR